VADGLAPSPAAWRAGLDMPVPPRLALRPAVVQAIAEPPAPVPFEPPAPVVSRLPEAPLSGPLPRMIVPGGVPVQLAEADAGAPTGGGDGAAAAGAAGAHSDRELDDLAHQLYDRLRSRLRMELLIDRERAGLITDLR
jgi:hypothetical protein